MANSLGPDQTAQDCLSDQGLNGLPDQGLNCLSDQRLNSLSD